MKFYDLEIQNFLTIENGKVYLSDRGLNVMQGKNLVDSSAVSNGAGKSSVVDALSWCLYGITARDVEGDEIINEAAGKNTAVLVNFIKGQMRYTVGRYRKHKTYKNTLQVWSQAVDAAVSDEKFCLTKGTNGETQKYLEGIMGCSRDVFLAAVYTGQENMIDLPKLTDRNLKKLIEEAAGMDRIEAAYAEANTRLRLKQNECDQTARDIATLTKVIQTSEEAILSKRLAEQQFTEQIGLRTRALAGNLLAARASMKEAQEKVDSIDWNAFNSDVAAADGINQSMMGHREAEKAYQTALAGLARLQGEYSTARERYRNAAMATERVNAQIANVDAEMAKPCPECGKPHDASEREAYLAQRNTFLAAAMETENSLKTKALEAKDSLERAQGQCEKLKELIPDVSELEQRRSKLLESVAQRSTTRKELEKLTGDADALADQIRGLQGLANPHTEAIRSLEEIIAKQQGEVKVKTAQLEEANGKRDILAAVARAFGPAGVRAHILDTVTPFLNSRTAEYLGILSDGSISAVWSTLSKTAAGEVREKFKIEVTNDKGGSSFKLISGGEKRKVRVATNLALQDLVASRASHPIDLWIGDEIDDAVDTAGLERLMSILECRARERGTVIIISHNDLSDWCDLTTEVVKYREKTSRIEGALCNE